MNSCGIVINETKLNFNYLHYQCIMGKEIHNKNKIIHIIIIIFLEGMQYEREANSFHQPRLWTV